MDFVIIATAFGPRLATRLILRIVHFRLYQRWIHKVVLLLVFSTSLALKTLTLIGETST